MASELVMMARCAERAERYDDMSDFMSARVALGAPLTGEERDILSAAFKGALTGRRLAVNVAMNHEMNDEAAKAGIAAGYRSKVQAELKELCEKVLGHLERNLIPSAERGEPKTFYLKMAGDYYRYMAEVQQDVVARENITAQAQQNYTDGMREAMETLGSAHPVRLGLALNFSVFMHQVLGQQQAAIEIAQDAYVQAAQDVPNLSPEGQTDAKDTMDLLRQNLELWSHQDA